MRGDDEEFFRRIHGEWKVPKQVLVVAGNHRQFKYYVETLAQGAPLSKHNGIYRLHDFEFKFIESMDDLRGIAKVDEIVLVGHYHVLPEFPQIRNYLNYRFIPQSEWRYA